MKVKKLFAVSLIVALVVAALPMSGVFAAGTGGGGSNNNNGTGVISQNEINNLQAQASFFNNLKTQPGQGFSMAGQSQQYLARLQFALAQAEALVAGRFNLTAGTANNGASSNGTSSKGTSSSGTSSNGTSTSGTSSSGTSSSGTTSSGTTTSGTSSNGTSTTASGTASGTTLVVGKYYRDHPDKLLAMYLHMIRQLREKLGMGNNTNSVP